MSTEELEPRFEPITLEPAFSTLGIIAHQGVKRCWEGSWLQQAGPEGVIPTIPNPGASSKAKWTSPLSLTTASEGTWRQSRAGEEAISLTPKTKF